MHPALRYGIAALLLGLAAAIHVLRPEPLVVPFFGTIEQVTVETKTAVYQNDLFTVQYPAVWEVYAIKDQVGFGPRGTGAVHSIAWASTTVQEAEQAATAHQAAAGKKLEERLLVPLTAGTATKLVFGGNYRVQKATYYILPTANAVLTIRLAGPGNKTLDTYGNLLLKTIAIL